MIYDSVWFRPCLVQLWHQKGEFTPSIMFGDPQTEYCNELWCVLQSRPGGGIRTESTAGEAATVEALS